MKKRRSVFVTLLQLLAILGWFSVIYATPYGIGTSPDSAGYIGVANNLLSGQGLTLSSVPGQYRPITQYPPLYPITITVFSIWGQPPIQAARMLAGLVFALNIFSIGSILYFLNPASIWPAVTGSSMMLLAPAMLEIHLMAWSEPLFILLSLGVIILMTKYIESPRLLILLLASFLVGMGLLTRYAGITVIAAAALGTLIFTRKPAPKRLLDALLFGTISTAPLIGLLTYNRQVAGSATNRIIAFHPITRTQLWQGLETFATWFSVPPQASGWIYLGVGISFFILLIGFTLYSARNYDGSKQSGTKPAFFPLLIWLLILFIAVYSLFLIISISFLDANTPLDNRILSPVFVSLLIVTIHIISTAISRTKATIWKWVAAGFAFVYVVLFAVTSIPMLRAYHIQGIGYSTLAWTQSPLIAQVRTLPVQLAIYSNAPDAISLIAERPAARLPRVFEQSTQQLNSDFGTEMLVLGESMADGEAVIVYFNQPGRIVNPSLDDIQEFITLKIQSQVDDGWIFALGSGNQD